MSEVVGQAQVATTPGRVQSIRLVPDPPLACREAVDAIHDAEWVVLGPGSWFTSVMPHLLVPDLRDAIVALGYAEDDRVDEPGEVEQQ